MIVENQFPKDTRVRKEAQSLREAHDITVIALKGEGEKYHDVVEGIEVIRVPEFKLPSSSKNGRTGGLLKKVEYVCQYLLFTMLAAGLFLTTYPTRRYKVIHAHNPPDTLFVVGLAGKLFSTKFVFDHHDLSPELFLARFKKKNSVTYRMLLLCEKLSCRTANIVIATNETFKEIDVERNGVESKNVVVVRNDPIVSECHIAEQECDAEMTSVNGKTVLLFLGCVNPQDGVGLLLQVIDRLVHDFKLSSILCRVVGSGDSLEEAKNLSRQLGIEPYVEFTGYVLDREQIKKYLQSSDICVEPAPDNEVNRKSTFIKIMEYMAAGKPIVAFDLKETAYSAKECALLVPPGDIEAFAFAVKRLIEDPELRGSLGKAGLKRTATELNWVKASENLVHAYRKLLCAR